MFPLKLTCCGNAFVGELRLSVGDVAVDEVRVEALAVAILFGGSPAPFAAASSAELTRPEPPTAKVFVGEAGATYAQAGGMAPSFSRMRRARTSGVSATIYVTGA